LAGFSQPPPDAKPAALKYAVILIVPQAEQGPRSIGLTSSGPARARAFVTYELSSEGAARAQAYVNYFKNFPADGQPMKLDCLIAAGDANGNACPRLTLLPLSRACGLAIDGRYKDREVLELARELQTRPHGRVILIAWNHREIPDLLRALGTDPAQVLPGGVWPDAVACWAIQLTCEAQGRVTEAICLNENLLPQDSDHPVGR
jgi:hypothetical protein